MLREDFNRKRIEGRPFLSLDVLLDLHVDGVASSESRVFVFDKSVGDMVAHLAPLLDSCEEFRFEPKNVLGKPHFVWRLADDRWITLTSTSVTLGIASQGGGKRSAWDGGVQSALLGVLHEHFAKSLVGVRANRYTDSPFEDLGWVKGRREARRILADLVEQTARLDFTPVHPDGGVNPYVSLQRHEKGLWASLTSRSVVPLGRARTGVTRAFFLRPGNHDLQAEAPYSSYAMYDPTLSRWARLPLCISARQSVLLAPRSWNRLSCEPNDDAGRVLTDLRNASRARDLAALRPVEGFTLSLDDGSA